MGTDNGSIGSDLHVSISGGMEAAAIVKDDGKRGCNGMDVTPADVHVQFCLQEHNLLQCWIAFSWRGK